MVLVNSRIYSVDIAGPVTTVGYPTPVRQAESILARDDGPVFPISPFWQKNPPLSKFAAPASCLHLNGVLSMVFDPNRLKSLSNRDASASSKLGPFHHE